MANMMLGDFIKRHSDGIDSVTIEDADGVYAAPDWLPFEDVDESLRYFGHSYACPPGECRPCDRRRDRALKDFSLLLAEGREIGDGEWRSLDGQIAAWSEWSRREDA